MINLHRKSDYQAVSVTLLFLVACGLIFHQEIQYTILYCGIVAILFIIVNSTEFSNQQQNLNVSHSLSILMQSIPIAVILFIATPKLPPLWQVPKGEGNETGLSESITPGDIADLAQSDDLVFRAEFTDKVPRNDERYWRAIVLDVFDGTTWSISAQDENNFNWYNTTLNDYEQERTFEYVVIAEPNTNKWLYSIDVPRVTDSSANTSLNFNSLYQLRASSPLYTQTVYTLTSYPDLPLRIFNENQRIRSYLQVPNDGNPRTREFIKASISTDMSFEQKLAKLQQVFLEQDFAYTLQPPVMPNDPVDIFLFDAQTGFCSHYASSFAYMLRLAGVPSRLVTGYQGGEEQINKVISVHQFDAHAWVEAYHPEQGWLRFDPTALVAPDRISDGLRESLENQDEFLSQSPFSLAKLQDLPLLGPLRTMLASIDYKWSQGVLGFDQDSQRSMLKQLFGEISARVMSFALALAFIGIAIFLGLIFVLKSRIPKTDIEKINRRFLRKIKRKGFEKQCNETISQIVQRIIKEPSQYRHINEQALRRFHEVYLQAMYVEQAPSDNSMTQLKTCLRKL